MSKPGDGLRDEPGQGGSSAHTMLGRSGRGMQAAGQITIRPVKDLADFARVEVLQGEVWQFAGTEIVPLHMLKAAATYGGLLLGAFDQSGELLGFVFGFLGRQDGRLKHHSHMMGVLPACQDASLGFRLKCAQRRAALEQGLDWATWTYDPLEGRNGYLNIGKLGAVCRTYLPNLYGELHDDLNSGLATDRFQVDWWLRTPRVEGRVGGKHRRLTLADVTAAGATHINQTWLSGGLRSPVDSDLTSRSIRVIVEIPGDFQQVKQANMDAARAWRAHTRELFATTFGRGYAVTEFISELQAGERRNFYLLERRTPADSSIADPESHIP